MIVMSREILASKTIEKNGFEFKLDLLSCADCGMSSFDDKWIRNADGPIQGSNDNFDCTWYDIGSDLTIEQAQEDFDRDNQAFDVHLFVTVSKNGIELINDPVIGSDYNYSEDEDLLLDDLIEYVDFDDYCSQAEAKVFDLIEALKL